MALSAQPASDGMGLRRSLSASAVTTEQRHKVSPSCPRESQVEPDTFRGHPARGERWSWSRPWLRDSRSGHCTWPHPPRSSSERTNPRDEEVPVDNAFSGATVQNPWEGGGRKRLHAQAFRLRKPISVSEGAGACPGSHCRGLRYTLGPGPAPWSRELGGRLPPGHPALTAGGLQSRLASLSPSCSAWAT